MRLKSDIYERVLGNSRGQFRSDLLGLLTFAPHARASHRIGLLRGSALQFGHFETVKPGEILDFSPGKSFSFFC
jgi:hypothetical protein